MKHLNSYVDQLSVEDSRADSPWGADKYLDWFMPQAQDSLGIRWG